MNNWESIIDRLLTVLLIGMSVAIATFFITLFVFPDKIGAIYKDFARILFWSWFVVPFGLIVFAACLNGIVLLANGMKMPVDPRKCTKYSRSHLDSRHVFIDDHTRFRFLCDNYAVSFPERGVMSIGDFLLYTGTILAAFPIGIFITLVEFAPSKTTLD